MATSFHSDDADDSDSSQDQIIRKKRASTLTSSLSSATQQSLSYDDDDNEEEENSNDDEDSRPQRQRSSRAQQKEVSATQRQRRRRRRQREDSQRAMYTEEEEEEALGGERSPFVYVRSRSQTEDFDDDEYDDHQTAALSRLRATKQLVQEMSMETHVATMRAELLAKRLETYALQMAEREARSSNKTNARRRSDNELTGPRSNQPRRQTYYRAAI